MICQPCGVKHGEAKKGSVSTYQATTCDWCKEEAYCVQEYKFGLKEKGQTNDE